MFFNFHVHSCYSLKDALPEPLQIAEKAKELGCDAFTITDHGNINNWIQAYKAQDKAGIQFIPGMEIYLIPEDKYWDWNRKNNEEVETADVTVRYHHLTLIAKNQTGADNLIKIYNRHEKHYGKECISRDILFNNSEGLIVLSGCVAGEPIFYIQNGMLGKAKEIMSLYKDKFGGDYYTELQFHGLVSTKIPEVDIYNNLVSIAKELDIKMVPTTDAHYISVGDKDYHNLFKAIHYGNEKGDNSKWLYDFENLRMNSAFEGDGYYMCDEEDIKQRIAHITSLNKEDIENAVANTVSIREKCEQCHFPEAKKLVDNSQKLRKLVENGFERLRRGTEYEEESKERIEFELSTMEKMGFTEYFINVYDIVNRGKQLNILVGPGRGCFLPNNEVSTSKGYKNIKDIEIGDKVLTKSGELKEVIDTYKYDVEEECIELSLSNGKIVTCTPDHKIYTKNRGYVEAKDLTEEDILFESQLNK